jgi:hypothetical protein
MGPLTCARIAREAPDSRERGRSSVQPHEWHTPCRSSRAGELPGICTPEIRWTLHAWRILTWRTRIETRTRSGTTAATAISKRLPRTRKAWAAAVARAAPAEVAVRVEARAEAPAGLAVAAAAAPAARAGAGEAGAPDTMREAPRKMKRISQREMKGWTKAAEAAPDRAVRKTADRRTIAAETGARRAPVFVGHHARASFRA